MLSELQLLIYCRLALLLVIPLDLIAMIRHKNNRPVLTKLGGYF